MVSILLPVYNGEKYLKKSIDSVISQEFTEFELLIGFNGTVDNSRDIANAYDDERIRIIDYGDDKGKGKTLNKMLAESRYDIIALQDDDDIWLPKKLISQLPFIISFDIVGSQLIYIDENDNSMQHTKPLRLHTDNNLIKHSMLVEGDNHIANTSAIFKKKSAVDINGWTESIDGIEDMDFWIRMIKAGNTVKNLDDVFLYHRIHKNSNFNINQYNIKSIL